MTLLRVTLRRVTLLRITLLRVTLLRRRLSLPLNRTLPPVGHGLHVGPLLEGLVEVADVARDVLVSGDGEGDDGL
jgi:hypothetical protein